MRSIATMGTLTTGQGKFYSNGLALDALAGRSADEIAAYLREVHALFARVLAFPRATIAALNGHAFAGGLMLALAHDARLTRADRGILCLPEVDLRLNFLTTYNVLEAMLRHRVASIFFASTSAVFGAGRDTFGEDDGPLRPISFYGARKLAAEGYVSVYVDNYGFRAWILRFPNVVGEAFDARRGRSAVPAVCYRRPS